MLQSKHGISTYISGIRNQAGNCKGEMKLDNIIHGWIQLRLITTCICMLNAFSLNCYSECHGLKW